MDMEKKKNKTDKKRLVASTDVQDAPAFGPEQRPPRLQSQHLLPRWSQDTVGPSHPCYPGGCAQASGAMPSSHENGQQRIPELQGQSRGCSEITRPAQPTARSSDPRVNTQLSSLPWAWGLRTGTSTFCAHSCFSSLQLEPRRPSLFPVVF